METLEEFATAAQQMVEKVGESFERPDDDWMPVLIATDREGQIGVYGFADFVGDAGKDQQVQVIRQIIEQMGITQLALVQSAWAVTVEAKDFHPEVGLEQRPSEHPERFEMVALSVMDKDKTIFYEAKIKRDDLKPPTLEPWTRAKDATGRFVEPLMDALKAEGRK